MHQVVENLIPAPPLTANNALNWIANFIWDIADDVFRDLFVRGKHHDVIFPHDGDRKKNTDEEHITTGSRQLSDEELSHPLAYERIS